tara:strand:- start:206 stop:685 length:480 start_codon:yes stop_codon:yes gene_type:complete
MKTNFHTTLPQSAMKNSSTAHNRMKINSKQDIMTNMKFFPLICIGLALALAAATTAAEPVEPWPTKVQLRSIEQAAYACSRDNSTQACRLVRQLADPLMDHSRLPGLCKDVLWSLMDEAKVANSNDFRRKDAITNTARRIPRVCAEPVMKKGKPKSRQA